ncbi:biotin--[acetyl-CoA-carboxylase] ligase [Anaerocolumna sedimenticola]|uniref:biotin--[biotin carboxyl-carrier protein] ligase n=1 Tax=Anaerocolumna sedimenticola TaxID=2696063 RepID=A0A6P1TIF7_9FIRM|nr:biotin--[acetyl-CoA-carboxylase] ligase [Anaerocolumna sedimenticola]QHQ59872.1 biotin--[acetyl-CoA-carboxylase] ligase [Anaerocolumna sedimenticola]
MSTEITNEQYEWLDASFIEEQITTKCIGKKVVYFNEVDSTNVIAKQLGKTPGYHGTLVLAEQQNAGRGRLGRKWSTSKGDGIWMTLILQPQIRIEHASMLTLVTALAVNQGIRKVTGLNSFIKWPNDIVMNGKKVCGILTEMSTINEKLECIVIGIGINANRDSFPDELKNTATSLKLESKKEIDRVSLIASVMKYFEMYYEMFKKEENLKEHVKDYNEMLINRNRQVKIVGNDSEYIGLALGINETGALLVQTDETIRGERKTVIKTVMSGEVSVRGVYGYV